MVRIDRVHTGGGDTGETSLVDGSRVSKAELRLEVVGTIDELNSILGIVIMEAHRLPERHDDGGLRPTVRRVREVSDSAIGRVQQELFDLGAELACPPDSVPESIVLLGEDANERLVEEMDAWLLELDPLTSFIMPTGEGPVAHLHHARTVSRRMERTLVRLAASEGDGAVRDFTLSYSNRLSDWCFVLGRWITRRLGGEEDLWLPIGERSTSNAPEIRQQQDHDDMQSAIEEL